VEGIGLSGLASGKSDATTGYSGEKVNTFAKATVYVQLKWERALLVSANDGHFAYNGQAWSTENPIKYPTGSEVTSSYFAPGIDAVRLEMNGVRQSFGLSNAAPASLKDLATGTQRPYTPTTCSAGCRGCTISAQTSTGLPPASQANAFGIVTGTSTQPHYLSHNLVFNGRSNDGTTPVPDDDCTLHPFDYGMSGTQSQAFANSDAECQNRCMRHTQTFSATFDCKGFAFDVTAGLDAQGLCALYADPANNKDADTWTNSWKWYSHCSSGASTGLKFRIGIWRDDEKCTGIQQAPLAVDGLGFDLVQRQGNTDTTVSGTMEYKPRADNAARVEPHTAFFKSEVAVLACDPGYFLDPADPTTCRMYTPCPAGTGVALPVTLRTRDGQCSSCAANYYQPAGNFESCRIDVKCGAGQYVLICVNSDPCFLALTNGAVCFAKR